MCVCWGSGECKAWGAILQPSVPEHSNTVLQPAWVPCPPGPRFNNHVMLSMPLNFSVSLLPNSWNGNGIVVMINNRWEHCPAQLKHLIMCSYLWIDSKSIWQLIASRHQPIRMHDNMVCTCLMQSLIIQYIYTCANVKDVSTDRVIWNQTQFCVTQNLLHMHQAVEIPFVRLGTASGKLSRCWPVRAGSEGGIYAGHGLECFL